MLSATRASQVRAYIGPSRPLSLLVRCSIHPSMWHVGASSDALVGGRASLAATCWLTRPGASKQQVGPGSARGRRGRASLGCFLAYLAAGEKRRVAARTARYTRLLAPYSPAAKKAKKRASAVHSQASSVLLGPSLAFLGPGKKGQDLRGVLHSWGGGSRTILLRSHPTSVK